MGMRRLLGRVRRRLTPRRPRPAILMYHRVASLRHDPWELAVDPLRFEEQIAYLAQHRTPLPMPELVRRLKAGTLPPDAVGVTFDDGYRDNLVNAEPVLARYGVPATVFLATGYIGREQPYWWDELAAMILESSGPVHDAQVCSGVTLPLQWSDMEAFDLDPSWRGWDEPRTARQRAYVALWSRMQTTTTDERLAVLAAMRPRFPISPDRLSLPMLVEEVQRMLHGGVMAVEAHTVHHASLTDVSPVEGREEIAQSAAQCREWSNRPIEGFAFPYGNYSTAISAEVKAMGLLWACTTEGSFLNGPSPDLFALPRLTPTNAPMENFARMLTG